MPQELDRLLTETQDEIFAGRFKEADGKLLEVIEILPRLAGALAAKQLAEFNGVIMAVLSAQQKRDYLLLADLLEYKLRPVAKRAKWEDAP
jgi:hypothetical protein